MGYSARYHAASLAAVFLALAIGILVGAEFGGEVLSDTRKSLERRLVENLEQSRDEVEALGARLERSEEFGNRVYPALVGDRLYGDRLALIGLGGLDADLVADVEAALEPTGGELAGIGALRQPPALSSLAGALAGTRFGAVDENPELLEELGRALGRQLAAGGGLLERYRGELFTRASGSFTDLDQVLIAYRPPDRESLEPEQVEAIERLEAGFLRGMTANGMVVVGIEATDADPSAVDFFKAHNLTSVDNVDSIAGRLAMVLALNGAQGSFGVKDGADSLLPDLITGVEALNPPTAEGGVDEAEFSVSPAEALGAEDGEDEPIAEQR